MTKELEALEAVRKEFQSRLDFPVNLTPEYRLLKKALTPPTVEEVCAALSEYLEREVKISKEKSFYYSQISHCGEVDEIICGYGWEDTHYTIGFEIDLPPHIITMIGKFYESLEEEK